MTHRGRTLLRLLATALLVASALLAARAARAAPEDAPLPPRRTAPAATTPLLSPRRLPQVFVGAVAARNLEASLAAAFASHDACVSVEGPSGPLARVGADRALTPASTEKLLTAAAALGTLGPDHRFATRAVAAAAPQSGVVAGDLYLVGGGDPILATPEYETFLHERDRTRLDPVTRLAELADAIATAGVQRIEGSVVGDDSRHDTLRYLPDWKPSYRSEGQVGPLGALTVDDGFTEYASRVAADDPALLAATRLADLLEARGVDVAGGAGHGTAPAGATEIAVLRSPPLAEIVAGMLTSSDNLSAELLAREVAVAEGQAGTSEAGVLSVTAALAMLGVPVDGLALHDGSGLAPTNLATCDAIVATLTLAESRPDLAALRDGLAVAAQTGTLALRFQGDPLAGVLHAKTGQIAGVAGLAGFVADAEDLSFAFIVNGSFDEAGGQALQAQVAHLVAAFPEAPPAADLVPPPAT